MNQYWLIGPRRSTISDLLACGAQKLATNVHRRQPCHTRTAVEILKCLCLVNLASRQMSARITQDDAHASTLLSFALQLFLDVLTLQLNLLVYPVDFKVPPPNQFKDGENWQDFGIRRGMARRLKLGSASMILVLLVPCSSLCPLELRQPVSECIAYRCSVRIRVCICVHVWEPSLCMYVHPSACMQVYMYEYECVCIHVMLYLLIAFKQHMDGCV